MLELILMLLGLAFSNNNANTSSDNPQTPPVTVTSDSGVTLTPDPGDTGGDTIPVLPPKK